MPFHLLFRNNYYDRHYSAIIEPFSSPPSIPVFCVHHMSTFASNHRSNLAATHFFLLPNQKGQRGKQNDIRHLLGRRKIAATSRSCQVVGHPPLPCGRWQLADLTPGIGHRNAIRTGGKKETRVNPLPPPPHLFHPAATTVPSWRA